MENVSYGIFTIFIAFVLFSVIKNVFFNANQISRIIRRKYLWIAGSYLSIFLIGISSIILSSKNDVTLVILDITFVLMSLPIIFTSLRIDTNDTSAYNKWYYSQTKKNEYKESYKVMSATNWYFVFNALLSIAPAILIGFFAKGALPEFSCSITFVAASTVFVFVTILINLMFLGDKIKKNLLYNYLWEKMQSNPASKVPGFVRVKTLGLFKELFVNNAYKDNTEMNEQIMAWIECNNLKK